ncbi:MAG TPA: VWA domain-containing protein [Bryobacteraceae bacterium]
MTPAWTRSAALLCLAGLVRSQTDPAQIRVDVSLVTVASTVFDRDGAFVPGLKLKDFRVSDNGAPRELQYLWAEQDLPLTVGLVVDVSGSQRRVIEEHRAAVEQFFRQVLGPKDQAFLVTAGMDVKLVTDLTGSIDDLEKGVRKIDIRQRAGKPFGDSCVGPKGDRPLAPLCGGTALWNAVYASAKLKMKGISGRKALIVLSDGMDTGSKHKLGDAIEMAQSADTLVYTIRSVGVPMLVPIPLLRGKQQLGKLADETGGRAFTDPKGNASEVYAEIEKELRSVYVLGFAPPEGEKAAGRHKLDVKVERKGVTVRARREYVVPPAP